MKTIQILKVTSKILQFVYLFMAVFSGFFIAVCIENGFKKEAMYFVLLSLINVFLSQAFKSMHERCKNLLQK